MAVVPALTTIPIIVVMIVIIVIPKEKSVAVARLFIPLHVHVAIRRQPFVRGAIIATVGRRRRNRFDRRIAPAESEKKKDEKQKSVKDSRHNPTLPVDLAFS